MITLSLSADDATKLAVGLASAVNVYMAVTTRRIRGDLQRAPRRAGDPPHGPLEGMGARALPGGRRRADTE